MGRSQHPVTSARKSSVTNFRSVRDDTIDGLGQPGMLGDNSAWKKSPLAAWEMTGDVFMIVLIVIP